MKASELIAHLEQGQVVATGKPNYVTFLRFEIWESDGKTQKYLGKHGWGSAFGDVGDRLKDLFLNPEKWVRITIEEGDTGTTIDEKATIELLKIGHFADNSFEWVWNCEEKAS